MNFLVVYSHPNPKSFNQAIKETLVKRLEENRASVRVRDLYALHFDPVLKAEDLAAFQQGKVPDDIKVEQDHVRWAEGLVFICPVWWGGVTANMRGYFDRVFSLGFAYRYTANGPEGLLKGKKAYLINTLGASSDEYERSGMFQSIRQTLDEVIFDFCGVTIVGHTFFGSVVTCPPSQRSAMLEEVKQIADNIAG
jgi:NAD(P)H dehydrogenase (quinone)